MKVKLKVFYNDTKGHNFTPNQEVEVDAVLGAWLVKANKAVEVSPAKSVNDLEPQFENAEEPPHYGAQKEPEPRKDDEKHDVMTSQPVKKPRRGKRGAK